jgi:hypothetical protein
MDILLKTSFIPDYDSLIVELLQWQQPDEIKIEVSFLLRWIKPLNLTENTQYLEKYSSQSLFHYTFIFHTIHITDVM